MCHSGWLIADDIRVPVNVRTGHSARADGHANRRVMACEPVSVRSRGLAALSACEPVGMLKVRELVVVRTGVHVGG